MKKFYTLAITCIVILTSGFNATAQKSEIYENNVWYLDKQTALDSAASQDKQVFVCWGKRICTYTTNVRKLLGTGALKQLVDSAFILWFVDGDSLSIWGNDTKEYFYNEMKGMSSFYLPVICIVSPYDIHSSYGFNTGPKTQQDLITLLSRYVYALTVNSGEGSGDYYGEGTIVNITADPAPSGKEFDKWTGDVNRIADVDALSTTYTMGSSNATVTATYKPSSDATLGSLLIEGITLSPVFDPNTTSYTMSLPPDSTRTLTVDATTNDGGATVRVNGNTDLKTGENTVNITVTAANGDTKVYTITVTSSYTATESIANQDIKVWNTNGILSVKSPETAESVNVYDLSGSLVDKFKKTDLIVTRDASSYPSGILIVSGSSGWVRKVVHTK